MSLLNSKRNRLTLRWALLPLFLCAVHSRSLKAGETGAATQAESTAYAQHATQAVQALQSWYDLDTGLYRTTGWWNSANAITVLADYARVTQSREYDFVFSNTFSTAQKTAPGFINKFYDDEGWWALAWIDAYGITKDQRYLTVAKSIFTDMTYGWDNTCSGGIWWSKDRNYKNAIANELFLSVAAQLANSTSDPREKATYLAWARREWSWFSHSGMINGKGLVNDGLTEKCENNRKTTWTYNQGVILGGLVALHQSDPKSDSGPALMQEASRIADAAIAALADAQGILHDPCEPNCGGDGTQFKGIFVRNLSTLEDSDSRPQFKRFLLTNADSIWSQVHPPDFHLGEVWIAPFSGSNASSQSSALDALVAAAHVAGKPHESHRSLTDH
ncbi:glycoside hydrolase family 76 protein [Acidicapsa ligni]|uniref:glycoside hydrolase family 76 protein n=1 Tax=Acidicapsa ligni TaxID=542300 RepID=UPI0021DFEBF9|nr:glycoside hydrolase family 76 protein [Acidicapsa ligni]